MRTHHRMRARELWFLLIFGSQDLTALCKIRIINEDWDTNRIETRSC